MGFKSLNPGPLTAGRGLEIIAFGFRHAAGASPDFLWQAGANAVASVTKDATTGGTYTVQLVQPYPREIVAGFVQLSDASATLTTWRARLDIDSYSASAGTFDIETIHDNDGDGDVAIVQPTDNAVISVLLVCQTKNILVEAHS